MPKKAQKKAQKKAPSKKAETTQDKDIASFLDSLKRSGNLGNVNEKIDVIPTGSWVLNRLVGDGSLGDKPGGIPRGYITEIFGDEATGKTTIGLSIAKQILNMNERVVYADFEQTLRVQHQYIENMGININPPNFLHITPTNFEDGVKIIGQSMIKLKPAAIIIDSVTAMIAKATFEGDPDDTTQIGIHARLTGNFLNWMSKKLPHYNCALILLNQLRSNIKGKYEAGPNEVSAGGRAIRFFSTVRIRLKGTSEKEEVSLKSKITGLTEKKAVSQAVKVIINKNKFDMPFKSGPIYITFGQGIDNVMSLVCLGINKKVIKKGAAGWYSWSDPNSDLSFKVQGKASIKDYLEKNPSVLNAITPYLMPTQDSNEIDTLYEELEGKGVENLTADEKEQLKDLRIAKGLDVTDLDFSADELEDMSELAKITGDD